MADILGPDRQAMRGNLSSLKKMDKSGHFQLQFEQLLKNLLSNLAEKLNLATNSHLQKQML